MLPLRLVLKNFLPYVSPEPVRFEGIHLACLVGPNGAGKSSLLDAITWVLWGSARAKRDNDLIYLNQREMSVQLDFEQEGQVYQVVRRRERHANNSGTSKLDLWVKDDKGQPSLISEPTILATQKKIDRLLRLDYETFCNSAFLQQGKADAFTTKTPKERKQILSDILGLAQWEHYEEAAKERQKALLDELTLIENRIKDIDTELSREPHLRAALDQALEAQKQAQEALQAAENRLKEVANAPIEMRGVRERLIEQDQIVQGRLAEVTTAEGQIMRARERIAEFDDIINRREDIEAGYAALQSARESDFELGEKLRQLNQLDKKQNDLKLKLEKEKSRIEKQIGEIAGRISGLERTVNQNDAHALEAVQAEISALHGLEVQRNELHDQIRLLGEQRGELEANNKNLHSEMMNIKDRLDRLENAVDAICPLCGQTLDDEHRLELVEQLTTEGKLRGDQYRTNQSNVKRIAADLVAFPQQVVEIDAQIKRLQPLMERAGALQAQIDAATSAASELEDEQTQLDTLRHTLDNEDYGHDIRAALADLDVKRVQIGYDNSSHDAAREQLNMYREYEKQQNDLHAALKTLPEVQLALDGACQRLEIAQLALEEDYKRIDALKNDMMRLEADVREHDIRKAEVDRLDDEEQKAKDALTVARQELKALDDQRARKADLEIRAQQKREEESLYRELRLAFGKNGIPAMIIETAIPELEIAANSLLARMTGGRMNLAFHTQREKVTGGMAETLEIQIADELGTRSYEMYSGGEAFRINFAIRVALSQMLARRAGAHLRTLFIDEGFGTQDEDGRNRLVEAITAIQDDFDLILVITHIDELRDSFPVHIVVEKTANGSQVSVR